MDLPPGLLPDDLKIFYRFVFLKVAQELEHGILDSLRTKVFPQFCKLKLGFAASLVPAEFVSPLRLVGADDFLYYPHEAQCWANFLARSSTQQSTQFKSALENWGSQWHLNDGWILDWALHTLDQWRKLLPDINNAGWASLPLVRPLPPVPETTFKFESFWNIAQERPPKAKRRMRQEFERTLKAFFGRLHDLTMTYQGRQSKAGEEHVRWLVQYQVLGRSYAQIGRLKQMAGDSRKTVQDAVRNLAQRIGLTLRPPGKPGRPRSAH